MSRRKFSSGTLLIASHNPGKVSEIAALLEPFGIEVLSASELDLPEPEETGKTFVANAELKAVAAASASGQIALADDSGLVVPALGGDPGIYSARWAGSGKDFGLAMEKVHSAFAERGHMGGTTPAAYFVCVLTLAWPDGHTESVEGQVHGAIAWPPRGDRGFGYDPIFVPNGFDITFGEMDPYEKYTISHRADAFRKLIDACFST